MSHQPGSPEPGQQQTRNPRRNLAGVGFVLLGAWFAWTSVELDASVWLRVPLVALGVAVLAYGAVQLVRVRR